MFSQSEQVELLDVANALADAARGVTLRYFRSQSLHADNKIEGGFDPVTVADREAEEQADRVTGLQVEVLQLSAVQRMADLVEDEVA